MKRGGPCPTKNGTTKCSRSAFVQPSVLDEKFVYNCIPAWDSVGHMGLIAALEEEFNIMMDTEDIIEFGSYTVGIDKLKKYGVDISA